MGAYCPSQGHMPHLKQRTRCRHALTKLSRGKKNEFVVSTECAGGPRTAGDEELFFKCPVTEWLVLQTVFKAKGFKCEFKTLISFL